MTTVTTVTTVTILRWFATTSALIQSIRPIKTKRIEGAGLMWVAGNSGPGGQEDHHEGLHNLTNHQNYESNEADCEAAGRMWIEDDDLAITKEKEVATTQQPTRTTNPTRLIARLQAICGRRATRNRRLTLVKEKKHSTLIHTAAGPLSYKEQIGVVLDALILAFPSGEAAFTENAAAFVERLDSLHSDFDAAFGSTSTCTGPQLLPITMPMHTWQRDTV